MMDNSTVGDILHCEEQLKTTLQYDDKEKLRQKLLLLQREYVRTAQRLQRAERSDGVRKPVTSHVKAPPPAPQGERGEREVTQASLTLPIANGKATDVVKSGNSHSIRPLRPSDAAHTTDAVHDSAGRIRPSPASQFRSRLSRQRSGTRRVDSVESKDGSQLKQTAAAALPEAPERPPASQSEELHPGTDGDSPSLLLTHWNTVQNKKGCIENKRVAGESEQREKGTALEENGPDSKYLLLTPQNSAIHDSGRHTSRDDIQVANGHTCEVGIKTEAAAEERGTCEDGQESTAGNKGGEEMKGRGLLDSCTLVEGLLFPAEYYVRTTRRMASSQSQPDMQAVILSQLNISRRRAGRPGSRRDVTEAQGGSSPAAAAPAAAQPAPTSPQVEAQDCSAAAGLHSLTSSDGSDHPHFRLNAGSSPPAPAAGPARGRRRRRGRPRGRRAAGGRCAARTCQQDGEASSGSLPVSPASQGAGELKPPPAVDSQPALTGTDHSVQSSATSGHRLYPIFLTGTSKTGGSPHIKPCRTDWRSLLLPSSLPSQTPRPFLPWSSALGFDIPQDFHLPDEQFASLKLHKLRQVAEDRGLERFSSPSYNTRRSLRQYESYCGEPPSPLSLPLSLTPTASHSPNPTGAARTPAPCLDPPTRKSSGPGELPASKRGGAGVAPSAAADLLPDRPLVPEDQCEGRDTGTPSSKTSEFNTHAATEQQREFVTGHSSEGDETDVAAEESHAPAAEDPREKPSSTSSTAQLHCTPAEPPVDVDSGGREPQESPETPPRGDVPGEEQHLQPLAAHTQLLLSPPPASAAPPSSSAPHGSLPLPSLGLTPQVDPLACSPSAPALTLPPPPPPHPGTLPLSPPPLSPCPSPPPSQAAASSAPPGLAPCEAPQSDQLSVCAAAGEDQSELLDGQFVQRVEEAEPRLFTSCTHTLKSPAGGSLVDACCLPGASGGLCVAAAGKWAVCLWSRTSPSDWTLKHTWSFSEPVISVLAVPDAAGLVCVTLGRLEIREVRVLSSSSPSQTLLCQGLVQAVVALPGSRVVCSLHAAAGSTLQLFTLSASGSPTQSQHLVAPDVCVRALAAVEGLPDALVGTDEGSLLFIWNLKSGQMLRRILLLGGSSNSACLRAYSSCGVLLVLLQHQLLSSLEEVGRQRAEEEQEFSEEVQKEERKEEEEEEEKGGAVRRTAWLSLVAVNPLNGRSAWASRLYPPEAWSGRLCEADADGGSVVGLSQSGCVCVWELGGGGGGRGGSCRMVAAPQGDGWQLARWGRGGVLVTGHHNGDVTLHWRHGAPLLAKEGRF